MIVSLPLLLVLLDFWPLHRIGKLGISRILREKIPLFAVAVALAAVTYLVQRASGALGTAAAFPIALRIENALVCFVTYIFQTFWPARLAVFYRHPQAFPSWEFISAAILLVAITATAFRFRQTHPYLLTGWVWYVITLLPVIGLVQVGSQAHADRYMYVPISCASDEIGFRGNLPGAWQRTREIGKTGRCYRGIQDSVAAQTW